MWTCRCGLGGLESRKGWLKWGGRACFRNHSAVPPDDSPAWTAGHWEIPGNFRDLGLARLFGSVISTRFPLVDEYLFDWVEIATLKIPEHLALWLWFEEGIPWILDVNVTEIYVPTQESIKRLELNPRDFIPFQICCLKYCHIWSMSCVFV